MHRLIKAVAVFWVIGSAAVSDPSFWHHEWPDTDFSRTSLDSWSEILSGGPPKDGIPALSDPVFVPAAAETRLDPFEPVITVLLDGHAPRAYPLRYLTWHEIVNDRVGDLPIAVTFCPLCNSAMTFDRRVGGQELTFGVSGKLRHSDMVMYDRETQSWWQQAIGTGIVGDMTGTVLETLPTWMESWESFQGRGDTALVMDQPNWGRQYGRNPYVSYDSSARPFLYNGELPPHDIHPLARVVRVGDQAWPLARLADTPDLTEAGIAFTWTAGQASALDAAQIGQGRDVGAIRVRDAASGFDLPHDVMFAFAFHAFWPDGVWRMGAE